MKPLYRTLLRWLLPAKVIGDISVCEGERRLMIVANYPSALAGLLLGLTLPRRPLVVLPPGRLSGFARVLSRIVEHVVLDLNDPAVIKPLLHQLRNGRALVTFPEGRVNDGSGVMKTYPVPAIAAMKSGATLVPVSLAMASPAWRLPLPGRTLIRILPPQRIEGEVLLNARARRAKVVLQFRSVMQQLSVAAFARKPVFESFLDAIARYGRRRTIIEDQDEQARSYGDTLKGSLAISRWISGYTEPGENVGVLLPNVFASVCAVMGLSAAGRVPTILNYTAGVDSVKSAVVAANVRTVITSTRFIEHAELGPLLEALKGCRILHLEDIRRTFTLIDKLWLVGFALRFPRRVAAKPALSDPAVVLFTSGSEDRPKGVVLSHDAVVSNVAQIRAVFDFSPDDKIFNPLPLYHAYSFTAGLALSLITGTRMFLYVSPLRYRAIPELIYRRDCTVLFGTSTFLHYYAQNADAMDFRSLRYVIAGGEKLSDEVALLWLEKFGLRIYEGYGTTETAPVISLSTRESYRRGCAGRFLPGMEYQIRHVKGIESGGVLHVRGPNLMLGYLRYTNPGVIEAPRSAAGEGWHNTGDVVAVDETGMVSILGRVRRFAKIAGEMVSLDVAEQVARATSPDHQHAALSHVSPTGGEAIILFTTDGQLTRADLIETARSSGAHGLAVARKLVILPEIPLLSTGKTDYVSLKLLLEDDTYARLLSAAAGRIADTSEAEQAKSRMQEGVRGRQS